MRRIICILISLIMILSFAAGCGDTQAVSADETSESVSEPEIKQTLFAVIYDRGNDKEYWDAVIEAFEADNAGVTVDAYIGDDAAYILRDNILAGAAPDFVVLPSDEATGVTSALILDKAILSIDDVERIASTLLMSGAMQNVMSRPYDDGLAYLAPLFFKVSGLIYNKTLIEEKGWSIPQTWSEFKELGEEAEKEKVSLFAYAGADAQSLMPMFASAVAGASGADALDSLLRYTSDWNSDAVKAVLSGAAELSEYTESGSKGYDGNALVSKFKGGDILFIPGDAEILASLRGENEEESDEQDASEQENSEEAAADYGFAAYPVLSEGDESVAPISFTEMYIPYEASSPDLAKKFMVFQYSDAAAKLAAEKVGEVMPVMKAVELAKTAGITGALLDSYSILGNTVTAPLFMNVTGENETLADEFSSAFSGILSGSTETDAAISKMNELYEDMQ